MGGLAPGWNVGDVLVLHSSSDAMAFRDNCLETSPSSQVAIYPVVSRYRLTLVHDDFDGETKTYREVEHGWSQILSGLKTLIETGQPAGRRRTCRRVRRGA